MSLEKWSKKDLIGKRDAGYKIIYCDDETKALSVKETLKKNKRCARAGYTLNRFGDIVCFVLTK